VKLKKIKIPKTKLDLIKYWQKEYNSFGQRETVEIIFYV